ncbi:MAG: hypothetical protein ACRCZD_19625 [Phycicoccus sp.]
MKNTIRGSIAVVAVAAASLTSLAAAPSAFATNVPASAGCPARDVSAGPMFYDYVAQDLSPTGLYTRTYVEYYNGRRTGRAPSCTTTAVP